MLNALAILESFNPQYPKQTLSEISRRLAIPKASAWRNLAALERLGYVVRDPETHAYTLGPNVLGPARQFLKQNEMLPLARPLLANLATETGETAHLGVLQGGDVIYIEIAESPRHVRAIVARGDRLPAHCVASGKAILAHAVEGIVEAIVAAGLPRLTPRTITSGEELRADLELTRRRGYGLNLGEWTEDVVAASAPVFSHVGAVVGAIGVAAPLARLSLERVDAVGTVVRRHADRLSALLGAPVDAPSRSSLTGP